MNHFAVLDLVDGPELPDAALVDLAIRICSSPLADDLLVVSRDADADIAMRVFGADGLEAKCCGNGSLLVSSIYGALHDVDHVRIRTCGTTRRARRREYGWAVELGPPRLMDEDLSHLPEYVEVLGLVRTGEPHLVVRAPTTWDFHVRRRDFERYCAPLRDALLGEAGVNVTMVFGTEHGRTLVRTFERGARRQTYSCGTGAISAAFALNGEVDGAAMYTICSPGGCHDVHIDHGVWQLEGTPHPIGRGKLVDDLIQLPIDELFDFNMYRDT